MIFRVILNNSTLRQRGLFIVHFNVEVLHAPFQRFLMGREEDIDSIPLDGSTSVDHFYRSSMTVAGDDHLRTKGISLVGRHEGVAGLYHMAASGYAVRILAAAFWAGAIGGDAHSYAMPFVSGFLRSLGVA